MASLEPKLFCSVARASGFVLCALASACLSNRRRELLRYNNVKRLVRINISRATPPHRRTSCSVTQGEFRPGPKRETIRGGQYLCQAQVRGVRAVRNQKSHLRRYTIPATTLPTTSRNKTTPPNTISLNLRYRFASGGDNELCGK